MHPAPGTAAVLIQAAAFAAERHRGQRRKGIEATPYINHPLQVAQVLSAEGGIQDPMVLCAALLHDTLEDTETTRAELEARFGPVVAAVVAEVSDDTSLPKETRKRLQVEHAPGLSEAAKLVKLADKIDNLRDLLACPPAGWNLERKRAYFDWAEQVVAALGPCHPKLLEAFRAVCARRSELA